MKKLIIFDLDGTLINSIADLANSTNYALKKSGFPTHEVEKYNLFVGNGISKLLERALPDEARNDENISKIRKDFLAHYNLHDTDYSLPYPGIRELLATLQTQGKTMAVASNKYQVATEKLVRHFFPEIGFIAIFGQREGIPVKPDPKIVFDIISIAGANKEDVLYIGDSGVDMQTANNANVTSAGVTWGFRARAELEAFAPSHIVDKAEEILNFV